jgi:hypothetical protein
MNTNNSYETQDNQGVIYSGHFDAMQPAYNNLINNMINNSSIKWQGDLKPVQIVCLYQ